MAQNSLIVGDGSGAAVITNTTSFLNLALSALCSLMSGASAPFASLYPGGTIPTGALWFNTSTNVTMQYNGTAWVTWASLNGQVMSSQNVVTGSRAFGTPYHNTTGKVMWVKVIYNISAGYGVVGFSDSSSSPSTMVDYTFDPDAANTMYGSVSFPVLPGNYYIVSPQGGSYFVQAWIEYY
jgi:hypothetical protein